MKCVKIATALLGAVGSLAFASLACAQAAGDNAAAENAALQEVTVTGSRVIANGNNSPTPVTVVSRDELMDLQPTTINDALNNLPVFQGSRGDFSQPNTTGLFGGGNPATDELNLRNLGAQRTLILFDGQRVPPTNALGIVDVDMIPQSLIQRVDVVTGGVSAVYGSDAVAGVVNYITDKNFNGVKVEGNYGISSFNDDETYRIDFAAGMPFADGAGHIEGSFDYFETQGVPHRNERRYYTCSLLGSVGGSAATPGTAANPYANFCNVHNSQNSYGGLISNGTLKGNTFDSNGVLTPFANGAATGTANNQVGGDGSQGGFNSLAAPYNFDQLYVRLDYQLTDITHFHTAVAANWKYDTTYSNPTSLNNQTFNSSNPYLNAANSSLTAAQMTSLASAATFTMSKNYSEIPLLTQSSNVQNLFINAGLEGKLGKYDWAVDANYGANIIRDLFYNSINQQSLAAALDAVTNSSGQIVCNASLTNSAYSNCVPFNAFGPNAATPAAIGYVTQTTHYTPQFTQIDANAHVSGPVFDLPAGPVTAALSAEYRKQGYSNTSDALPTQYANCTGLRYNCTATTLVYVNSFGALNWVYDAVKEGALETDIPLLKNVPFVQALNINGAARYTSYQYGGNAWTWKVGLEWHMTDDLTLRATRSQDIEAPSLEMLFGPTLYTAATTQDLLIQPASQATTLAPTINIGNSNVVSEVAQNVTAGFVYKPHFVPGLAVTLDYYHIDVNKALTQIQGQAAATQQICNASGGTALYCSLIVRPFPYSNTTPANLATTWYDAFENVSGIITYGADLEINYAHLLFNKPFSVRLFTNYQPHFLFSQPGAPTYDFANVTYPNLVPLQAVPAVQATVTFNYAFTEKFTASVTEKWRDSMILEPVGTGVYNVAGTPAYYTTNLNLSYKFWGPSDEVYLNIQNVGNKPPAQEVGLSANSGFPLTDSPVGRFIILGVRTKF